MRRGKVQRKDLQELREVPKQFTFVEEVSTILIEAR
jgi:hypothetical protein